MPYKDDKSAKEVSLEDLVGLVAATQGSELKSSKSTVEGIEFESKPVKLDLTISFREE